MNAARRKQITEAVAAILEARGKIEDARGEIASAKDEEQDYYDNMPESIQQGEKGSAAETVIEELDEMLNTLDEVLDAIDGMSEPTL